MGKVAFGSYRISIRSNEHRKALVHALKKGCSLIDTSANYTNGESEELIGDILKHHPEFNPIIVTKAGYIQGKNLRHLEDLNARGLALEDVVVLDEHLKHSIHPEFLKHQLQSSLERLKKSNIDIFLLHNPEYYFKSEGANTDEYYRRIEKAFRFLESAVDEGLIKSYGISSNNFVLPPGHKEATSLKKVLEVAAKIKKDNHFQVIQFPFNLIEIGALEKFGEYDNESLLELAKLHNLTTMINRPLNAFSKDQLVRLATYDFLTADFDEESAERDFKQAMSIVEKRYGEQQLQDEQSPGYDFYEIPFVKQFIELWKTLPSPDAVEQVYYGHFFPFLARIWGNGGLNPEESRPFYKLLEHSYLYSRINMTKKAEEFQKQASGVGLIPEMSERPFAVDVVETYLNYGFDYILVGMRKVEYVDQLCHLF